MCHKTPVRSSAYELAFSMPHIQYRNGLCGDARLVRQTNASVITSCPQLKDPRNMLTISLLAVLVPVVVQAINAYDPIIQYLVPYTTLTTSTFWTINTHTYVAASTATLASSPASATPFSTATSTNYLGSYVTWIQYHFSSEDVPVPWATIPSTTFSHNYQTYTTWYEQTVITAPSYCSLTTWTHTTSSIVEIPHESPLPTQAHRHHHLHLHDAVQGQQSTNYIPHLCAHALRRRSPPTTTMASHRHL
ncbi:hypothetical protein EX30DRAFT_222223 [Ascodesmis nigricans]|uniref:Uncharacterized protein n=1 Tax=Ascodesmis nigricans TaxID=341454 RepID=A0A4S2MZS0_9PEZI|nr:hypothetical protein EX30DRAFT_222223 [Ascodesmis nigricans]